MGHFGPRGLDPEILGNLENVIFDHFLIKIQIMLIRGFGWKSIKKWSKKWSKKCHFWPFLDPPRGHHTVRFWTEMKMEGPVIAPETKKTTKKPGFFVLHEGPDNPHFFGIFSGKSGQKMSHFLTKKWQKWPKMTPKMVKKRGFWKPPFLDYDPKSGGAKSFFGSKTKITKITKKSQKSLSVTSLFWPLFVI